MSRLPSATLLQCCCVLLACCLAVGAQQPPLKVVSVRSKATAPRVHVSASSVWFVNRPEKVAAVCFDSDNVTATWYFAEVGSQRASWSSSMARGGLPSLRTIKLTKRDLPSNLLNPLKLHTVHLVVTLTAPSSRRPFFSAVLPVRVALAPYELLVSVSRMVFQRGSQGIIHALLMDQSRLQVRTLLTCRIKEKATGKVALAYKGLARAGESSWIKVPFSTKDLPTSTTDFVASCVDHRKLALPASVSFRVIDRNQTDKVNRDNIVGTLHPMILTSSQSSASLQEWLESIRAKYATGQPLFGGRFRLEVSGVTDPIPDTGVKLSRAGRIPRRLVANVSAAVVAALNKVVGSATVYAVAHDRLSKNRVKLPFVLNQPPNHCVGASLTVSPAKYIAGETIKVEVCAGNCSAVLQPVQVTAVAGHRRSVFGGHSKREIAFTGIKSKGDCSATEFSTGFAESVKIEVLGLEDEVGMREASMIPEDGPLAVRFGKSNCSETMSASTCVLFVVISRRFFSGFLYYEVSAGPLLVWSSGGPVLLLSRNDSVPLSIPAKQYDNDLTVVVRLVGRDDSQSASARTSIVVSRSKARKRMSSGPFLTVESEGTPGADVSVKVHAPRKSEIHIMAFPLSYQQAKHDSYSFMDVRRKIDHSGRLLACLKQSTVHRSFPPDESPALGAPDGLASQCLHMTTLQSSSVHLSSWDVPATVEGTTWPPITGMMGAQSVFEHTMAFPRVFASFLLQAVVAMPSGRIAVTNMASLQGRVPSRTELRSSLTVPDGMRGGVATTISCVWTLGKLQVIGLKTTAELLMEGVTGQVEPLQPIRKMPLASDLSLRFNVTTDRGGVGKFHCTLTVAGFTWVSSKATVNILPKCVPLACDTAVSGPCANLHFPAKSCRGLCRDFDFTPQKEASQMPLNHTYTSIRFSPIQLERGHSIRLLGRDFLGWNEVARPSNHTHSETFFVHSRHIRIEVFEDALQNQLSVLWPDTCDASEGRVRFDAFVDPVLFPASGNWGAWSPWSTCNTICGKGMRQRRRRCNNPAPLHGGKECPGSGRSTEQCGKAQCKAPQGPVCGQLPGEWPSMIQPDDQNRKALRHSWPWMAVIYNKNRTLSTGSVLCCGRDPRRIGFVLTTASSLRGIRLNQDGNEVWATLGRYDLSDASADTVRCDVIGRWIHESYDPRTDRDNVALLKVRCPPGKSHQTVSASCICLASSEDSEAVRNGGGGFVRTAGWGIAIKPPYPTEASNLRERELEVDPDADCTLGDANKFCVVDSSRSVCPSRPGDDGGPVLLYRGKARPIVQVGVLESGRRCTNPRLAAAASVVDVSRYLPWITSILNNC